LHTPQLTPLPLTVSCFSKIQIGFTFLVPADPGRPGQTAVKRVCVMSVFASHTQNDRRWREGRRRDNKYVGPSYSKAKIYAVRLSHSSNSYSSISAAGAHATSAANPPATTAAVDRRDGQTDTRPFYNTYCILPVCGRHREA